MDENCTLFYFIATYHAEPKRSCLICSVRKESEGMLRKTEEENYSPSDRILKKIFDFAKSYDALKTTSAGYVELNLN